MTGLGSKTNCDIDTHEENRTLMSFNGNECCWSVYRWILLELICNSIVLLASQNSFCFLSCWSLRIRTPELSLCCRLEPVIIELERQRSPVVVIAHQVSAHKHIKSPYQMLSMT